MDLWGLIIVEKVLFTEIMRTDLVLEIVVQVTQKPDFKEIVKLVVQKESVVLLMPVMLVTAEMSIGMIHVVTGAL